MITGGKKTLQTNLITFSVRVGLQLAENIPPSDFDPLHYVIPGTNAFEFKNITRAELVSMFKKVKASKAPGLDKISGNLKQQGTP